MTKTLHNNIRALGLLLIASAMVFAACGGGSEPEDVQFDLAIEGSEIELGPSVMKVKQGDDVTINIDSDKMGSFHLHGYDIETDVGPSNTATMSFTANATGSFPITFTARATAEAGTPTRQTWSRTGRSSNRRPC